MAMAAPPPSRPTRLDRRRACAAIGAAGLVPRARASVTALRLSGTGSALGGLRLLAAAYQEQQPGLQVQVLPAIGTPGAIQALIAGHIEMALTNRLPVDAELALAALSAFEYARTPIAIAVAPGLGLGGITSEQLAGLYRPGATFPNGQRARPVLRLANAADLTVMRSISPAVAAAIDAAMQRPGMMVAATDSDAATLIRTSPGAFGGCAVSMLASERLPLVALALDGRAPSVDNYASGVYPYGKSLCAAVRADAPAPVARFAAYLRSPPARALLRAHAHLPT